MRRFACGLSMVALAASAAAAGRAKLLDARWQPEAAVPAGSRVSDDGQTLTTPLPPSPTDLVAHATLGFDVSRGNDGILSFLSSHPWVRCEAPDGLIVPESGSVAVVCTADAHELARLERKTRVYLKADPPGGGAHRKLYWILLPPPK